VAKEIELNDYWSFGYFLFYFTQNFYTKTAEYFGMCVRTRNFLIIPHTHAIPDLFNLISKDEHKFAQIHLCDIKSGLTPQSWRFKYHTKRFTMSWIVTA